MTKFAKSVLLFLTVMASASPAWAQDAGAKDAVVATKDADGSASPASAQNAGSTPLINFPSTFGAGLIVIGAALGIGKLAASAVEGMARQPEVAGNIQTAMIIAAALIEGFTFFALVICFMR